MIFFVQRYTITFSRPKAASLFLGLILCICGFILAQHLVKLEESQNHIAEERLAATEFVGDTAAFGFTNHSFQFIHAPNTGRLYVTRVSAAETESWEYLMSDLLDSGVQSVKMLAGRPRELFFAARNLSLGTGLLLHCDFGWNGESPTFSFSTLLESSEIGDVTGISDISAANNAIAMLDYTNAKLWYVDRTNGTLTLAASSENVPDMVDFQGLRSGPIWAANNKDVTGAFHWLGRSQNMQLLQLGFEEFLNLRDFGADGSMEVAELTGIIDF